MTTSQLKDKIIMAYKILLKNDHYLLEKDVNERTISHKLAEYLQMLFPEYNVDCEYNKNFKSLKSLQPWDELAQIINQTLQQKTLDTKPVYDNLLIDSISVHPDIIIHKRGTDNNFVLIETKKTPSAKESILDEKLKLEKIKSGVGSKHAYLVTFPVAEALALYQDSNLSSYIEEF
ncbi:MAG: hypothetical protein WCK98_00815 [bacterium]